MSNKKKMIVEWDDDKELSESRKKPGAKSPLVRDSDNNLGQVVLHEIDDDDDEHDWQTNPLPDPEPSQQRRVYVNEQGELVVEPTDEDVAAALLILGVIVAVRKAAPHVKRWWNDQAVPFLTKSKSRLSMERRAAKQASVAKDSRLPEPAPTESSTEVVAALEEDSVTMSIDEARERFVAALVARLFSDEQLRLLHNARIEDDGAELELSNAIEMLTPQQLGESITMMLEAHPSWPNDETLAELERVIGRSSRDDDDRDLVKRRPLERGTPPTS